ncbi:hypothetical protein OQJ05_10010 [Fluoribacter gormanii]|uniref:hypothetical protein n=1 Tax=Fluoribacter gormanii TaxID=464 RepID=UPI002243F2E9|nr:hypothetical protein [Fluoribacter gormanii]MCW8444383.1 hypothetical protein [Fluoribacter gormanii]
MPNPYNHFLKLDLDDTDLKQLKDAFYGKMPQETDDSLLKLELNNEDFRKLEDAFYGKQPPETEPENHLKKRKKDSIEQSEDDTQLSLKKRKNFPRSEQYRQMKKYMFKLDLDIETHQEDFDKKNKEDKPVSAAQNMFFLDSKTGNVMKQLQSKKSKGPQHRYIFRFNTHTGKLTEPKEEQDQPSFSVNKP